tara:strand:- start:4434 stop:5009 length:576 start_codon:yes stop_codon:yes gene_type:complete
MNTDDLPEQNTRAEQPPSDHKAPKMNKNGQPRKALSKEDAARRAEILRLGREKALAKKKALKENAPTPPVSKPIPEPQAPVEEENASEPENFKVMSLPKKKRRNKGKKIIIMDESESSSEEEVIVKKKKSKRKTTPPPKPEPKPEPPPPPPAPKPSIPELSQEEIDKLRRDKLRKIKEKEKKDKLMSNIFG